MKTLIAYATRYGTCERCARSLARSLGDHVDLLNVRHGRFPDGSKPDFGSYDAFIIGGPIYGGKIMRDVPAFCESHRELLEARKVGLYVCCLYEGAQAEEELAAAYPPWLTARAVSKKSFGGAVRISRLKSLDRFLMKRVADTDVDLDTVDEASILQLARDMAVADDVPPDDDHA